ncbi:MAG: phosphatase PAP2 family protein [Chloroflexi bacterium]|nr:phosphatase PAP2 family protein [Chloroflexota bacterium]
MVTAATLLIVLAWWLRTHPFESFDIDGLASISGWDWTGADALFSTIEVFTAAWFGAIIGGVSIAYLFIRGHTRQAIGLAVAGAIVGGAAILADFTLGEWVGRDRPLASAESASFPSGHAFLAITFFGAMFYLAPRLCGPGAKFVLSLRLFLAAMILGIGLSRIYLGAHWLSDVIGGFVIGGLVLYAAVELFHLAQRRWPRSSRSAASLDNLPTHV